MLTPSLPDKVLAWIQDSQKAKEKLGLPARWQKARLYYEGRQWEGRRLHPDFQKVTVNMMAVMVESQIPVLLASRPQLFVIPPSSEYAADADSLQKSVNLIWHSRHMPEALTDWLRDGLITGTGILKTVWSKRFESPVLQVIAPEDFFPDPNAFNLEDAEYVCCRYQRTAAFVKRNYGYERPKQWAGLQSIAPAYASGQGDTIEVVECWHENGRRYTLLVDGKIVRGADLPNFYYDEKRGITFPLAIFQDYSMPRTLWGMGENDFGAKELYDELNDRRSQISANAKLLSFPFIKTTANSGIRGAMLRARPGQVLRYTQGTDVDVMGFPPMPAHLVQSAEITVRDIERLLGVHEVMQGKKPGSLITGAALQEAQEIGLRRPMFKSQNMENALATVGRIQVFMLQRHYTGPRQIAAATPMGVQQAELELQHGDKVQMQVEVQPGGTIARSQVARAQMAIQLYQLGAIDQEALLDAVDFERRDEVIARMQGPAYGQEMLAGGAGAGAGASGGVPQEQYLRNIPTEDLQRISEMMQQGQAEEAM